MDQTVLKIALAGFLHDIGKFADKDTLNISEQYIINNADLYQPHYKDHYSHRHAVYTAAFIEYFENLLPDKFNKINWGLADTFINLAAGHHNPSTPIQWIIAVADRISSGWDRDSFEKEYNLSVAPKDYKKTRLLPVFENLMKDPKKAEDYLYSYPLRRLSPKGIFPSLIADTKPKDNDTAALEYRTLFDEFVDDLNKGILHKNENIELWFEHFDSLFMIYASSIPQARAGSIIPDVSLYDHSKITSALAVTLYLYHFRNNSINVEAIKEYDEQKFLLISGDFYGIQDFIFSDSGEAGKGRAKILRGRSFAVSLFSELAADMLCRDIGIPSCCIMLNAAGKFTIIAPNTGDVKQAVSKVETQINDWLMEISFGENSIGITTLEASPGDFSNGRFLDLWDSLNREMDKRKYKKIDLNKHAGTVEGYLDSFNNNLNRPLCPFCRKRPSNPELEGCIPAGDVQSICSVCRDHIWLGEQLVKKNRIAVIKADADIKGNKLYEPIFGYYQVAFIDGGLKEMAKKGKLLKYWDISINPDGELARDVTSRFINGYVPLYSKEDSYDDRILAGEKSDKKKEELIDLIKEESPKTFGHLASKALNIKNKEGGFCGIEALGILKADVDQLGILMSCGLKKEQFTISRLATLSRQLNFYFAVYLPHLLKTDEKFIDIYTVFAGGDDLFLIGPWNRIIELVTLLRETFADYVCHNNEIHFSAGISIDKPNTPLDKLAVSAEEALEKSKNNGRNRITLFSETVEWAEFFGLLEIKNTLQQWYEKELVNKAMIYRLNDFIGMAELERQILKKKEVHIEDMECLKWHSMFSYTMERNVGNGLKSDEKNKMKIEFSNSIKWLESYGSKMKIALWDILYNYR
ncbi:MAG: type III-A CRISPR-associated protein Cas10/Csm1 [Desulfobacteraceae bacterium]|jgi:CRISPR-associated protein Csm1